MGEYFKKEEEEIQKEPVEDDDDNIKDEDLPVKYTDINAISIERNKVHHEMSVRVPEYKERIGRLNLNLFGDPENPDWESSLDRLKDELNHPMTKTHPIASKTMAVVREIEDLQKEYGGLHKLYAKFVKEVGQLLDDSINLFIKKEGIYEEQIKNLKIEVEQRIKNEEFRHELKKGEGKITEEMVADFMENHEGQSALNAYFEDLTDGEYTTAQIAKEQFILRAKHFFERYSKNPKEIAEKLFLKVSTTGINTKQSKFEKLPLSQDLNVTDK